MTSRPFVICLPHIIFLNLSPTLQLFPQSSHASLLPVFRTCQAEPCLRGFAFALTSALWLAPLPPSGLCLKAAFSVTLPNFSCSYAAPPLQYFLSSFLYFLPYYLSLSDRYVRYDIFIIHLWIRIPYFESNKNTVQFGLNKREPVNPETRNSRGRASFKRIRSCHSLCPFNLY